MSVFEVDAIADRGSSAGTVGDTATAYRTALDRASIPLPSFVDGGRYAGLAAFLAVALLAGSFSQYSQATLLTAVYAMAGIGLVLVFGVAGQLSMGHSIFLGAGAFISAYVTTTLGLGLEIELLIVAPVGMVLGLVMGVPSLRVNELYLALATFAVAFIGAEVLIEWTSFTGGGSGKPSGPLKLFGTELRGSLALVRTSIVLLALVCWLIGNVISGRTGRAMNALRTSESAARSAGINVAWLKILAFGISGAVASVAGVLYIHAVRFANPAQFGVDLSILLVLALLIGGRDRLFGAVLGAAFVQWLPETFRGLQEWEGLLYGVLLILLMLYSPGGLAALLAALWRRRPWATAPAAIEPAGVGAGPLQSVHLGPLRRQARTGRLEVSNMSVTFGGVRAVDDVSFCLEPGAVIGLIGSNGAGKSTCFNALTGHVRATGRFVLDGRDVSGCSIHERARAGLGRTFQNLNLHGDQRVIDHVLLGLDRHIAYGRVVEVLRLPQVLRAERHAHYQAAELLDHMDLLEVWNERVEDLPYGLQKRVDVARALAGYPDLVLLDEPAAGLPMDEAHRMMERVLSYADHIGAGVLVIEHNVELVAHISSEVIVMDAGRIIVRGEPRAVMRDERVIAAYLGVAQ